MYVKNVERLGLKDFEHLDRERERIRGMVEQWIGNHRCLMEVDSRIVCLHPDGLGIGDEIDVVATSRELLAKLGSDDARATVGRVSGDADTHMGPQSTVVSRNLGRAPCLRLGKA